MKASKWMGLMLLLVGCSNQTGDLNIFVCENPLLLSEGDPVMLINRVVGHVYDIRLVESHVNFHVKWAKGVKFALPMKFQIVSREGQDEHSYVSLIPDRIPGRFFREKFPPATDGWMCIKSGQCFIRNMQPSVIDIDTAYFLVEGEVWWAKKEIGVAVISTDELSRRSKMIGAKAVNENEKK